jgi:hypothetical protein
MVLRPSDSIKDAVDRFGRRSGRDRRQAQCLRGAVQQIVDWFISPIFHVQNPQSSLVEFASTGISSSRNRPRARCKSTPTAVVVIFIRSPISR